MSLARYFDKHWKLNPDNGCHEWLLHLTKDGYGRIRIGSQKVTAHRMMFEIANGPIPEGLQVCHRCDNRKCVNVDHLFLGTNFENHQDAKRKGRKAFGERQGLRKLTEGEVISIRERYKIGIKQSELASMFKVSQPVISQIVLCKTWRHLPP